MFKLKYIALFLAMFSALITFNPQITLAQTSAPAKSETPAQTCDLPLPPPNATPVVPLRVVQNPRDFLNQNIKMKATFDKFSTLGLDYDNALRETTDYVGFLIQRDDTDHNVPLSEMKLFLKRDYAETLLDLDTGDKIEIYGKVFSAALGDPWIDVYKINILKKVKEQAPVKK